MLNIFLFLGISFLIVFLIGRLLEKIRVPWVFGALILGIILSVYNPFNEITSSQTFAFLAQLGMYFLLFIVGYEIDIKKFRKNSRFIIKATFFIILFEAFFGTLFAHYVFKLRWLLSSIVALSFATVGEAILIPILDKFKMINTKIGQSIIGIGTFDDIFEIFILVVVVFLIGAPSASEASRFYIVIPLLLGLFALTFGLTKLRKQGQQFQVNSVEMLFLMTLFIFFLFLGVGSYADSIPIASILAGIAIKTFVPDKRLETIESEIKTMCYGLFAPLFFIWVGIKMNISYLSNNVPLIFLLIIVTLFAKIMASFIAGRKELGLKKSVILGIGLSVRFSTSIIIIKILFENRLIGSEIYSVLVASSVIFNFIIPFIFSKLLINYKTNKK